MTTSAMMRLRTLRSLLDHEVGLARAASDDALHRHPLNKPGLHGCLRAEPVHQVECLSMCCAIAKRHQRVKRCDCPASEVRCHVLWLVDDHNWTGGGDAGNAAHGLVPQLWLFGFLVYRVGVGLVDRLNARNQELNGAGRLKEVVERRTFA